MPDDDRAKPDPTPDRSDLAEALDQLHAALGAADWSRALTSAIEAWRATRSVELADLIDRITERCELPPPPHTLSATHRWWMARAVADPDPVTIGGLLATFRVRMHVDTDVGWVTMSVRWSEPNPIIATIEAIPLPTWMAARQARGEEVHWPQHVQNWVDRLAAMIRWPDDPRLARVLVDLLANPDAMVYGEANAQIARTIADRLIALADRRVSSWLAELVVPSGHATYKQRITNALVPTITAAIPEPPNEPERIAACVARLPADVRSAIDLEPLWRQIAEHPDDDAPRLVLADALIANGENRGELIVLQCATDPERRGHANTQAHRLLRKEWPRWMGDLALVLVRKGTEMTRGMLEKIRIGMPATPAWAWDAVCGHRELALVREVRPAHVLPATFAKFVAQLERSPRMLGIDAQEVFEELLKLGPQLSLEEVFYSPTSAVVHYRRTRPTVETVFHQLAQLAPDLERLELGPVWWVGGEYLASAQLQPAQLVALLARLPGTLPKLRHVRIREANIPEQARAAVRSLAFVEVIES